MNQDRIRDRILRRASRMWGYSESETENSFDPLLGLLISACASELEKLSFEQENSQSRIIDRILEVMFPEEVAGILPSHTLLQVTPSQNNIPISLYNSFKTTKRKQNIYNPQESKVLSVSFSPTIPSKLTTAKVKYIAYGDRLVEQENFFFEDIKAQTDFPLPTGELWLGLETPKNDVLEDLQFFIDVRNNEQKELFYYYLKLAKILYGGNEYLLEEGYNVVDEYLNLEHIITKNYNTLSSICNDVNQFYYPYFYTLKGKLTIEEDDKEYLNLINGYFPELIDEIEDNILWIKFNFSTVISQEVFQNVRFMLNCVPAINIRHKVNNQRINGTFNIFPIDTLDHFLDIDFVSDDQNHRFDLKNTEDNGVTLVLRRGGVSRFDSRDASEMLEYLLDLIKNETAAFATLGADQSRAILKGIQENMASLQQIVQVKNFENVSNPYLIINSTTKDMDKNFQVAFWNTLGEEGNGIKPGTKCEPENTNNVNKYFLQLATILKTSIGARDRLTTEEKLLQYRSALLTRGRIVTIADIKAFGMSHFKNTVTAIEVVRGTKKEVGTNQGFSRTIDIYLVKKKGVSKEVDIEEWEYLKESFMLKLKSASANMYPYRLFEKR